jgi:hypothetical protein
MGNSTCRVGQPIGGSRRWRFDALIVTLLHQELFFLLSLFDVSHDPTGYVASAGPGLAGLRTSVLDPRLALFA